MALPQSTLSLVCRSIADFLVQGLDANANAIRVMMGAPAEAAPGASPTEHRVNLFFYRIEPSGFFPDLAPDEIWRIRLHCLITAFGMAEGQISAGENDLRLLGEIVRLFHETPIMNVLNLNGTQVRMDAVFHPLEIEDINHLWATQGDVAFRPSAAYELSLVPIIPKERDLGSPLVARTAAQVYGTMDARHAQFTADGQVWEPDVAVRRVSGELDDWAPAICLVYKGRCTESLRFAVGSVALTTFNPRVWVAGPQNAPVTLRWEIWDRTQGWRTAAGSRNTVARGEVLDPDQAASAVTVGFALPFKDHPGQAVLYAERSYVRGSDGASLTVRSNPVLINLYQVS
jgi:hypothetical protein